MITDIADLLKLLEHWGPWKRIIACPGRLDALEEQVRALQEKPKGKRCDGCGEYTLMCVKREFVSGRYEHIHWTCSSCAFSFVDRAARLP